MVIDDKGIIVLSASQSDNVSHPPCYCEGQSFDFTRYRIRKSSQNDMHSRNFESLIYPIKTDKSCHTVCLVKLLGPRKDVD